MKFQNAYVIERYCLEISKDIFVFIKTVIWIYIILINKINYSRSECRNNKINYINYILTSVLRNSYNSLYK